MCAWGGTGDGLRDECNESQIRQRGDGGGSLGVSDRSASRVGLQCRRSWMPGSDPDESRTQGGVPVVSTLMTCSIGKEPRPAAQWRMRTDQTTLDVIDDVFVSCFVRESALFLH